METPAEDGQQSAWRAAGAQSRSLVNLIKHGGSAVSEDMDVVDGNTAGLMEAIDFRYVPIRWLCGLVRQPVFGSDDPQAADQLDHAELLYRRYLATRNGPTVQRAYMFVGVCLLFFGGVVLVMALDDWSGSYEPGHTPSNSDQQRLRELRLELAGAYFGGSVAAGLGAAVWGNHLFAVAATLCRHTTVQLVTATVIAAALSYVADVYKREYDDNALDVPFENSFFTGSICTAVLVIFSRYGGMQWPAATLMVFLTCGYWIYKIAHDRVLTIISAVLLFGLITRISRADDRKERQSFLMQGMGGVIFNRYLLAARPLYRSDQTTVLLGKDLWAEVLGMSSVALKLTKSLESFEAELQARFGQEPSLDSLIRKSALLDSKYVVPVVAWHEHVGTAPVRNLVSGPNAVPANDDWGRGSVRMERRDGSHRRRTSFTDDWADTETMYCIAMPMARGNLRDTLATEDFAGKDVVQIQTLAQEVAECLSHLHAKGQILADLRPSNLVLSNGRWKLIDLDSAVPVGARLRQGKFTEAYMPPEVMKYRLVTRGCQHTSLDPVVASPALDIWSFGVVLYELLTGFPLFRHQQVTGALASLDECQRLKCWRELSRQQLAMILSEDAACSLVRRVMAADLVAMCLQGNPENRIESVDHILAHPFFSDHVMAMPVSRFSSSSCIHSSASHRFSLRSSTSEQGFRSNAPDVIISYSSSQLAQMKRLRQSLNMLGISTADGSQVPPGMDWRIWYFQKLEGAKVFLPILSKTFMKSPECNEEVLRAQKKNLPVVACMADRAGCEEVAAATDLENDLRERIATYNDYLGNTIPAAGDLFGKDLEASTRFFDYLRILVQNLLPSLEEVKEQSPQAILLCAESDMKFTHGLRVRLEDVGIRVDLGRTVASHWHDAKILVPVLSDSFLFCSECTKVMLWCTQEKNLAIVPVLCNSKAYSAVISASGEDSPYFAQHPGLAEALPFLCSVLNRCNRIPPNTDFSDDPSVLEELRMAILEQGQYSRSITNLVAQRVPKYAALIGSSKCVPRSCEVFLDNEQEHMLELCSVLQTQVWSRQSGAGPEPKRASAQPEKVLISHNHHETALRLQKACQQHSIEAILLPVGDLRWYRYLQDVEICLLSLTPEFVRSSWCEGQLTFAKDCRKIIVPVIMDEVTFAILNEFDGRENEIPSYLLDASMPAFDAG